MKDLEKKYADKGITFIKCDFESANDFYTALKDMQKYANDSIQISGTSREGHYELVINEDTDIDDTAKPTNTILAKKKKPPKTEETEQVSETSVEG